MNDFSFANADSVQGAVTDHVSSSRSAFIGGGTNLLDLMKEGVARADRLIDINRLPLKAIDTLEDGGLRLGALATNTETAYHPEVEQRYPLLSKAILSGASAQLRNMATNGGNLMQRTRCYYFYDTAAACNKRSPGAGCDALKGLQRIHAILGASNQCIAVHPSDMCVALAALEAVVHVVGSRGERSLPFADFHRLPGDHPEQDNFLGEDELITAIDLPKEGFAKNFSYVKARERNSYAFALASAAVGLKVENGMITTARIALGGVAHKPWRVREAELVLEGATGTRALFAKATDVLLAGARGYGDNDFKIQLAKNVTIRALEEAFGAGSLQ